METIVLKVEGMSCSHCEKAIMNAVNALDGVSEVTVSLEKKTVTVEHNPSKAPLEKIKQEIEDQGYDVV